jgi:hypothetical protein
MPFLLFLFVRFSLVPAALLRTHCCSGVPVPQRLTAWKMHWKRKDLAFAARFEPKEKDAGVGDECPLFCWHFLFHLFFACNSYHF